MTSTFDAIDVGVDLASACKDLDVPPDQRALISVLFSQPDISEAQAGKDLGWSERRTERVVRSLRADRGIGKGLRSYLSAYQKKPARPVREMEKLAA